ncbi:urease accessory protein UreF [Allobranchiibius huperziae]|uniref:Urease accessory protein n=1 Tax=Allobranchiibius huperziae TaxID=1874116 RepID=A0A853DME9_9MICO|nr:urease accessory UreF family protein [Allobranchiibius huperziae]NYJ75800.1 urease accessory protein [Allobranchiibius huperziae]
MSSATGSLATLLLGDARLPTGGHTQSGGLEPALLAGMPSGDIPAYLTTRLRTATLVDAATAVVALRVLLAGGPLEPVEQAWAARTPSHVVRQASVELGRGYERLLARLTEERDVRSGQVRRGAPRPIAIARIAARLDVSATDLARVICHDDVQSVCAAALKLAPLDPVDTVVWALEVAPLVEQIVVQVADLRTPADIPAPAAPAAEIWQHAHATARRRLFRA